MRAHAALAFAFLISASLTASAADRSTVKPGRPQKIIAAELSQQPPEAKPAPVEMLPMSTPPERPMQSMTSGYSGCHQSSETSLLY